MKWEEIYDYESQSVDEDEAPAAGVVSNAVGDGSVCGYSESEPDPVGSVRAVAHKQSAPAVCGRHWRLKCDWLLKLMIEFRRRMNIYMNENSNNRINAREEKGELKLG